MRGDHRVVNTGGLATFELRIANVDPYDHLVELVHATEEELEDGYDDCVEEDRYALLPEDLRHAHSRLN